MDSFKHPFLQHGGLNGQFRLEKPTPALRTVNQRILHAQKPTYNTREQSLFIAPPTKLLGIRWPEGTGELQQTKTRQLSFLYMCGTPSCLGSCK